MSVIVEINIAQGAAHRWMAIERTSIPARDADGVRSLEEVGTYRVTSGNKPMPLTQVLRTADFEHRYSDDVTILIAKAGAAIREKYGRV